MYHVIGADGKEYGPFTADQVRQWVAEGRANLYSRVRRESETTWQALGEMTEFADLKQRQAESGPPPPPPISAEAIANDYLSHNPRIDIGGAFGRGWALVREHPGLLIGTWFLYVVITTCVAVIPFIGWLASIFINGPLLGGVYYLVLRRIRGEQVEFGQMFDGFKRCYLQLVLVHVVSLLLIAVGLVLCLAPGIYLAVSYMFAVPLVIDKNMDFWTALEVSRRVLHRQWWIAFGFLIVMILTVFAGLLACLVGVFVAMPLNICALLYVYEDHFSRT